MKRNIFYLVAIFATVLGIVASVAYYQPKPVQLQAATWLGGQAKPLPAFELTDHNGNSFNNQSMMGKWNLLFFGFTNCPDICPDALQMLSNTIQIIQDSSVKENLQITFISIDPDRDSLDKMKTYVTYFNRSFLSATAEIDKVNVLTDAVGILHYTTNSNDEDVYEVAHSGSLILIDPQGRFSAVFGSPHDSNKIAHDLMALIKS